MYYNALIITLAVSLIYNILSTGYMLRFMRRTEYYKQLYEDAVTPVVPPDVYDPYEGVKTALEYNWKEDWD